MKPCLHGSDAHKIADLFRPVENRFCWIKADPTFEGLRQVLYEPADRVHIGPSAPVYHDDARVIDIVRLSHSSGWFDDVEIPLNAGLVSIIGQKGSGKSALAEMIAYAAGSWAVDEAGSFLRRAGSHLKNMKVELVWADGALTTVPLGDEQSDDAAVRYLSQRFVERLCSDDHLGEELVEEIENVIFSYIEPSDTLNASSFRELRALRTDGTRTEGQRLRDDIIRLIAVACELRERERKVPEKKARLKTLAEERKGLEKQLPKAASAEEEKTQKALHEKRMSLSVLQKEAGDDKQKLQKIKDLRTAMTSFTRRMDRFYIEVEPALKEVGISQTDRAVYKPAFPGDTEAPLAQRQQEIKALIAKREGDETNPAKGTIRALEKEIAELAKKECADKAKAKRIEDIQKRISAIHTETERLNKEIAHVEGPNKARLAAATSERMDAYTAYFQNLKAEQSTLEELYEPVTARLRSEGAFAQEQDLEFSIRWEVDLNTWLERGGGLFDQRRAILYGTMERLARHRPVYLADAEGLPDSMVQRDPVVLLVIDHVKEVAEPIIEPLRNLGIRSLREALKEPESVSGGGDTAPAPHDVVERLRALRSAHFRRTFMKRLGTLGVEPDLVRHDWHDRLSRIRAVRFADTVEVRYRFRRALYPVQADGGFDPGSGTFWMKSDGRIGLSSLYEAIAAQLVFKPAARPLHSLALERALELEIRDPRYGRPHNTIFDPEDEIPVADTDGGYAQRESAYEGGDDDADPGEAVFGHSPFDPDPSRNTPNPERISSTPTSRIPGRGSSASSRRASKPATKPAPELEQEHIEALKRSHSRATARCVCASARRESWHRRVAIFSGKRYGDGSWKHTMSI